VVNTLIWGGFLRRKVLSLAAVAVCFALRGFAQAPHPHHGPPLVELFGGNGHPRPVPANVQSTAQVTFDASNLGSPQVLDKGWRVGITANPAAANPDFDDSTWAIRDAQDAFADVNDEDHTEEPNGADANGGEKKGSPHPGNHQKPFVWFRLHIRLAPNHGPMALLIELPVSQNTSMFNSSTGPGVDVFANGQPIKPEGPHGDNPQHYEQISRIYNLNVSASETSLVLVVRTIYIPFGYGTYTSFFSGRKFHLGNREDLDSHLELWSTHALFERLPRVVNSILLLVLALFLLALFFTQKGHIEYLWLALHELALAPIGFVELAGSSARMDTLLYGAAILQLVLLAAYLYFEFLIAFLSLRRHWNLKKVRYPINALRYTAPILLGVGPVLLMVGKSWIIGLILAALMLFALLWFLGWLVFIFITLIAATARRNFEAGLLLIPLVLDMIGIAEPIVTSSMGQFSGHAYHSPLTLQAGPVPIHFASIADFAGILAIVIIIFIRFLRVQRDQERVSSELAAARSVQELMIPHERIETPGFEVDSIYEPAAEVGGDFFHVQPTEDGGLLVIIGDVAGKGLKAAMNVSMIMGGLRRTLERSPARILESLNRVLTGSESFTTCQVAWFGADGEVVLANAGHLPPYLNSQEVSIPGGLPLGVLPDVSYEETRLYLHPGDRILLMSDGVVEARQPSGELFGFDRVHNLSGQTAFYIADAAKAFGQEDDITILTVRRLAQAMAA
jgi:sigma-B regulation protein RsbU (phosphoserine phosphatase)